jgi:hypothetical protein
LLIFKKTNVDLTKFTNKPNIDTPFYSFKIDSTYNKKQSIFIFIQQKGNITIGKDSDPENVNSLNWQRGINSEPEPEPEPEPEFKKSLEIFLDNKEVLSRNNNSLYNIRNMTIQDFDEIFISSKGGDRKIFLYTKK